MSVRPARNEAAVRHHDIDDATVVMRLDDGEMFELEGPARAIWKLADGTRDRDAILTALVRRYAHDPEIASDLDRFLGELAKAGLLA